MADTVRVLSQEFISVRDTVKHIAKEVESRSGKNEINSEMKALRTKALIELDTFLPIDAWTKESLTLLRSDAYQEAIAEKIMAKLPRKNDPAFGPIFNRAFFETQFSYRLIAYSFWGSTSK